MTDSSPRQQLDQKGFVVLRDWMEPNFLESVRARVKELFAEEGEDAGGEFKQEAGCRRLANLVNKGTVFQAVVANEGVLDFVRHVLGRFKLSSLNVRSVDPRGTIRQPLHADMAALPDEHGDWVCNTLWMLDDITEDNGALRVVPGSHRFGSLPSHALADPLADHPDEIRLTGTAGTVIVMNAHLWHGGLENRTDHPRTAMHAFYCRRDKPQQQYQQQLLSTDVQATLSPALREILALDDPENDRLSSAVEVRSGFMK